MSATIPPDGLGPAGLNVWQTVLDDLAEQAGNGDSWELDGRERLVLTAAARQADLVADLEAAIDRDGLVIEGSRGQSRMNSCATELRQSRLALARLLGELALPDETGVARTSRQRRAQQMQQARQHRRYNPPRRVVGDG